PAGPRHARPLPGTREAGWLGAPTHANGAATRTYESPRRGPAPGAAGAPGRRYRPDLLPPAALPALPGTTARQAGAVFTPGPGGQPPGPGGRRRVAGQRVHRQCRYG